MRLVLVWVLTIVLAIGILVARLPLGGQVTIQVGDVAPADIVAPRQATYVSQILTQQRRDLAASAVADVYDAPQARIGRQQLTLANQILDFIATVRSDSYADLPAKTEQIKAIAAIDVPQEMIQRILALPGPAWDRVAPEIQVVLERAMREEIKEATLTDERRKVAARVRLDLSDEDAAIVTAIVQDLLVPNSFLNAEKTEQRRQQAREGVDPVTATVERNEIILRAGDIATALDIEALEALGLRQNLLTWKDVTSVGGMVLLLGIVGFYYLRRQEPQFWADRRQPLILALVWLIYVLGAKIAIPGRVLAPYIFPYAALAMTLMVLLNPRVAVVSAALCALLVGWLAGSSLELAVYALSGSLAGALKLRRGEHLVNFAWAALYVAAMNLLVLAVFRLPGPALDLRGLAEMCSAAIANGLLAMTVTLFAVYLVGTLFGLTTPLNLLDIARPTHPLLRQLLLKAPGTYHHTLIVSNMAERAAEVIGADALLARVGAYYHDVGKTIRPYFFIENRTDSVDLHSRLEPYISAQIIISHVKDGIELARKYRLPQRIIDFIPEHHGTLLATYFYREAVRRAGSADGVDRAQFAYPGPKPRSRETAITMLADGTEAMVRSQHPASIEELERIVSEGIQSRVLAGELDDCPLTLEDLHAVHQVFVDVLRGLQHPRVVYPPDIIPETPRANPASEDSARVASLDPVPSEASQWHGTSGESERAARRKQGSAGAVSAVRRTADDEGFELTLLQEGVDVPDPNAGTALALRGTSSGVEENALSSERGF